MGRQPITDDSQCCKESLCHADFEEKALDYPVEGVESLVAPLEKNLVGHTISRVLHFIKVFNSSGLMTTLNPASL